MTDLSVLVDTDNELGECPLWSVDEQALYWIDIRGCAIHRWQAAGGAHDQWQVPSKIGSIAHFGDGRVMAALQQGFVLLDPATGGLEDYYDPEPDHPERRLNDGKVDRKGRFWCGSVKDPDPEPVGVLYRMEKGGACDPVMDGIRMPNALCWSPDDTVMYFADSFSGEIGAFDYDLATGTMGTRRTFATIPSDQGVPDGATVDTEGYLWSAHMNGGRVTRYAPDGTIDRVIEVPASRVTCCGFGGPDMDMLFITTGCFGLTDEQREAQPHAGALFVTKPGVIGIPEPVFGKG